MKASYKGFLIGGVKSNAYLERMYKTCIAILCLVCLLACKKKSAIQEDLVILAMTTGQWRITSFQEAGIDRTADFSMYRFQYNTNNTVNAFRSGILETTGTWNGSAATMTISAQFPNASQPLLAINGLWNVIRNSWTYVEASQTQNGQIKTLRLDKD